MIGAAVYSALNSSAVVRAECKDIYPHIIPQGRDAPAIVYTVDDDERTQTMAGESGYRQARISLDCYSSRQTEAENIADAVESALVGYRGQLGSTSPAVTADHIRVERAPRFYENDSQLYRVALQLFIGYE